jgi:hypothetical protein
MLSFFNIGVEKSLASEGKRTAERRNRGRGIAR